MRSIPTDTYTLLEQLAEQYPPRCRKPAEDELAHERYAGKADLIQELRSRLEAKPTHTFR